MPSTLIRTVLLYLLITASMKIMGKRQIGQLQLSELVTVTLLSELASYAILDPDIPMLYSVAPIFILIFLEVGISFLSTKLRFISRLFDGKPTYIIFKGELCRRELAESRLTLSEVISEIRSLGYGSISEIYYMILEPSGKVSVIPKCREQSLSPSDVGLTVPESGIDHALIFDGTIIKDGLRMTGLSEGWLLHQLRCHGAKSPRECFYLAVNDEGDVIYIGKGEK